MSKGRGGSVSGGGEGHTIKCNIDVCCVRAYARTLFVTTSRCRPWCVRVCDVCVRAHTRVNM